MTSRDLRIIVPSRLGAPRPLIGSLAVTLGVGVLIGTAVALAPEAIAIVLAVGVVAWLALSNVYRLFVIFLIVGTLVPDFLSVRVLGVTIFPARLALMTLLAALACRWLVSRGGLPSLRTPLNAALLIFVGAAALSLLVNAPAMSVAQAVGGLRVCFFLLFDYAALFLATTLVIRLTGRRAIPKIAVTLVVLLAVAGALGVAEHLSGVNAFQLIERLSPSLLGGQGEGWGEYITTYRLRGAAIRSSATFAHFLDFGTAMAMGIPLTLHFLSRARTNWRRVAFSLALALEATGLVYSYSRGALIAVGLATVCYLALSRDRRSLAVGGGGAGLVAVLCLALPGVSTALGGVFFPQGGYASEGSLRARLDDYAPMTAIVAGHPLLGIGPGMLLRQGFVTDHPQLQSLAALDNYYLVVVGETGLVGLAAFLTLCSQICRRVWRPRRRRAPTDELTSFRAAVVSAAVAFFFLSATFDAWAFSSVRVFWVLVALGVAAADVSGLVPSSPRRLT